MSEKTMIERAGVFLAGVLFGTAGLKILASRDAKKTYVQAAAAALRARECVLDTVTKVQENAEDILAEAKMLNAQREEEDTEEAEQVSR